MPPDDIIDLTGDDGPSPAPRREPAAKRPRSPAADGDVIIEDVQPARQSEAPKKRKSLKRERMEREFREYVATLPSPSNQRVLEGYAAVNREKKDLLDYRKQLIEEGKREGHSAQAAISALEDILISLDEDSERIRTGKATPDDALRMGSMAERKANIARTRLESYRREAAINRMQQQTRESTAREMLNNRAYVDARSASMVTPVSVTTNTMYQPTVNPASSNQQLVHRAMAHPLGLLPDRTMLAGTYLNGNSHASGLRSSFGTYDDFRQTPYQEASTHSISNYEHLVDLALNEAEPLDMPPQLLCDALEHQRQGLGWLVRAEKGRNKGSILADDMGLGKTVQTIALLYANPPDRELAPQRRLTLIVCPVALIATWVDELKERVKSRHRMRVYVHHRAMNSASYATTAEEIYSNYDVVICTYQGISMEFKAYFDERIGPDPDDYAARAPRFGGKKYPLFDIKWYRVVLDEAHMIKNRSSKISIAVSYLKATHRLALSGTPMQNSLAELYPLIRFLHIEPYEEWSEFQRLIPATGSSTMRSYTTQKSLAAFLSAVMLRRKKDTLINGVKIIDSLPPKHVKDVEVVMPKHELENYKVLESQIHKEVNKISATEGGMTFGNMLVLLLRLRQATCHHFLIEATKRAHSRKVWSANKETRLHMQTAIKCHRALQRNVAQNDPESRVCVSCEGPAVNTAETFIMVPCAHFLCAECSEEALSKMDEEDGNLCPLCGDRYRYLGNLEMIRILEVGEMNTGETPSLEEAIRHLQASQRPRLLELRRFEESRKRKLEELHRKYEESTQFDLAFSDGAESDIEVVDEADPEDQSPTLDSLKEELNTSLFSTVKHESVKPEEPSQSGKAQSEEYKTREYAQSGEQSEEYAQSEKQSEEYAQSGEHTRLETLEDNTHAVARKKPDPMQQMLDIDEVARLFKTSGVFDEGWCTSAKIEACVNTLREIWTESPADKVIIFTSFTTLLDILAIPLESAAIPYELYTGKMGVEERNGVLETFKSGRCKLLLASLKAGNVGLTLTQANRVIIMEPFWNPYVEEQAQDRVYRIGQSREVTIYRLRVKDTVEDRIVNLQDHKREIIEGALDNGMKTRTQNLSRSDIMFALGLQPRAS